MEATAKDRELIAREMEAPPANFRLEHHPFAPTAQMDHYHNLLIHILA
jgi:hypothetical protein